MAVMERSFMLGDAKRTLDLMVDKNLEALAEDSLEKLIPSGDLSRLDDILLRRAVEASKLDLALSCFCIFSEFLQHGYPATQAFDMVVSYFGCYVLEVKAGREREHPYHRIIEDNFVSALYLH